jgi:hypothetical protein
MKASTKSKILYSGLFALLSLAIIAYSFRILAPYGDSIYFFRSHSSYNTDAVKRLAYFVMSVPVYGGYFYLSYRHIKKMFFTVCFPFFIVLANTCLFFCLPLINNMLMWLMIFVWPLSAIALPASLVTGVIFDVKEYKKEKNMPLMP